MKYKLKAISCQLFGVTYHKINKDIFDTEGKFKGKSAILADAEKAGFLEKIEDKKPVSKKNK